MAQHDLDRHITAHYSPADLTDAIRSALTAVGKAEGLLTPDDLASLDQFHARGKAATLELAERAGIMAAMRVLDLGGGVGGAARLLAATYGCRVEVLELMESYCQAGELLTERCGLTDRVTFQQGSATAPPYPDATFDLVWMQHSSMNIADKARLFQEARRVLRPDGHLAIHEVVAGPVPAVHYPVPWASDAAISFLCSADVLCDTITAAGFTTLAWHDETAAARDWFQKRLAPRSISSPPSPLGLQLLLGPTMPTMLHNLLRNLTEQRVGIVQAVFTCR